MPLLLTVLPGLVLLARIPPTGVLLCPSSSAIVASARLSRAGIWLSRSVVGSASRLISATAAVHMCLTERGHVELLLLMLVRIAGAANWGIFYRRKVVKKRGLWAVCWGYLFLDSQRLFQRLELLILLLKIEIRLHLRVAFVSFHQMGAHAWHRLLATLLATPDSSVGVIAPLIRPGRGWSGSRSWSTCLASNRLARC